jgi:hypothetical protein
LINVPPTRDPIQNNGYISVSWVTWLNQVYNAIKGINVYTSPNGTQYKIVVDDFGNISADPL